MSLVSQSQLKVNIFNGFKDGADHAKGLESGESETGEHTGILTQLRTVQQSECKFPEHRTASDLGLLFIMLARLILLLGYFEYLQLNWTAKVAVILGGLGYSL